MGIIQYLVLFCVTATVANTFVLGSGLGLGLSRLTPTILPFIKRTRGGSTYTDATITTGETATTLDADENERILAEELKCCEGEIIDTHLHIAPWFTTADQLVDELQGNSVSIGILFDPYSKFPLGFDINTFVHSIASTSNKRVYMLASMNMTHDNWDEHRDEEMQRLKNFLEKDEALGGKMAPPNTCLPLASPMANDFIDTIAQSTKKLVAIHIGTTPFRDMARKFGMDCFCSEEYVDPSLLLPKIQQYPDVKFLLLHSGHEFLPEGDPEHYGFKYTDICIDMAKTYPNVYLSMSAVFAQSPEGVFKYPGGDKLVQKMKDAGICHKVFWGSDASYFKGQIKPVLVSAIRAMINAGWTQEERTWALRGCAKDVFSIV